MKEIKQNHTESNLLYDSILDEIVKTIQDILLTLEFSKHYMSDWNVYRAYKKLTRLKEKIT